jgi:uncharacterized protein (TIGR00645 family)
MSSSDSHAERWFEKAIFASRWLQAPLYLGLIAALGVYVYQFFVELWHIFDVVFHFSKSVADGHGAQAVAHVAHAAHDAIAAADPATRIMLGVLGLIDVVMIANLLIMVIIGGYETFVSRLHLEDHADQPEWLSHVNAGMLKVKLATALISISSIHLLKTFIEVRSPGIQVNTDGVFWQVTIHAIFLASAILLAWTDRVMLPGGSVANAPKRSSH